MRKFSSVINSAARQSAERKLENKERDVRLQRVECEVAGADCLLDGPANSCSLRRCKSQPLSQENVVSLTLSRLQISLAALVSYT